MVMLDLMLKSRGDHPELYHGTNNAESSYSSDEIIVAHFDHGIRRNSREDAEFVRQLAKDHGLNFVMKRAELGEATSEAEAREARYNFLMETAGLHGEIYVAHHLDDLIETVRINFLRGTGWRGLAAMDRPGVRRPLLEAEMIFEPMDKRAIFEYAAKRGLCYREDPTNADDEYLRNRIRHEMNNHGLNFEQKLEIWKLWQAQKRLKREIDQAVAEILPEVDKAWSREWFRELVGRENAAKKSRNRSDSARKDAEIGGEMEARSWRLVALELLRAGTLRAGISATRPQLEEFRQAILSYQPGKKFNLPGDKLVKLTKDDFKI